MTIAEIYQMVSNEKQFIDVFRIRNVNTLEDYLTFEGWTWQWDKDGIHMPLRISAYALDRDMAKLSLDCNFCCYTLLSIEDDELNFFKATPMLQIRGIMREIYKGLTVSVV